MLTLSRYNIYHVHQACKHGNICQLAQSTAEVDGNVISFAGHRLVHRLVVHKLKFGPDDGTRS